MEVRIVIIIAALLVVAYKTRASKNRQTAAEDAAAECQKLAEEVRWALEAARKYLPGSSARAERAEKARDKLRRLKLIASKHPELAMRGLETLQGQMRDIESKSAYVAPPKRAGTVEAGRAMVCLLDTETTGLSHADEPITLAILLIEVELPKGHFVREVEHLYEMREPSVPIHPRAAAVHGLAAANLKGKRFDHQRITEILQRADYVIAHNAQFDRRMLNKIMPEVEELAWRCSVRDIAWPTQNKKLNTICEHFSIERPVPHNSMADVRALADCLLRPTGKTARSRSYLAACLRR